MSRIESFSALQVQTDEWRRRNFDEASRAPYCQLAGMMEELGELAHAYLKLDQGIRTNENLREKEIDAVGDLVIYLCGYCSARDIALFEAINQAWNEIKDRDWVKYPETGRPPETQGLNSLDQPVHLREAFEYVAQRGNSRLAADLAHHFGGHGGSEVPPGGATPPTRSARGSTRGGSSDA